MDPVSNLCDALEELMSDGRLTLNFIQHPMPMREHIKRSLIAGVCLAAGMVGALLLIQNVALYFGN